MFLRVMSLSVSQFDIQSRKFFFESRIPIGMVALANQPFIFPNDTGIRHIMDRHIMDICRHVDLMPRSRKSLFTDNNARAKDLRVSDVRHEWPVSTTLEI
jgi:hypothetical protein